MDGKGRALDNIYIERLWHTIKCRPIHFICGRQWNKFVQGNKEIVGKLSFQISAVN